MKEYIERADIKALLERYGATDDAMALIDALPAADVAEVRHGRWEWKEEWGKDGLELSLTGCHFLIRRKKTKNKKDKYYL